MRKKENKDLYQQPKKEQKMKKKNHVENFARTFMIMILFCVFIFSTTTVFAERIISEKKTNSSYEIVIDGENSLKPLVTAIEKSAKALHDAAAITHVAKFKVHVRIENTGRSEIFNKVPGNLLPDMDISFNGIGAHINQWAFNSIYIPYTSCNWYQTSTKDFVNKCKDNVYDMEMTFSLKYFMTLSKERTVYNEMKKLASTFSGSKLEKIHAAYSYITHNIKYSSSNDIAATQSGIMTFKNKEGICAGKARLFTELCYFAGIECYEVGGESKNGLTGHSWNVVKYNGKWYLCDVTNDLYTTLLYFMRGTDYWNERKKGKYDYDENDYTHYVGYSKILMSKIKVEKEGIPHPDVANSIVPKDTKETDTNTTDTTGTNTSNTTTAKKNPNLTVTAKELTVKRRKQSQTIKRNKVFNIKNAYGVVSFIKTSGSNLLQISKNGDLIVNGNGVKGKVYKIKVRVNASGNSEYKSATKYVIVNVLLN